MTRRIHCPACGEPARLSPHWFESGLRSRFTFHVDGDFVLVIDLDLDDGMSVTNDAERVVEVLARAVPVPLHGRRVLYRDTDGRWDELVAEGGRFSQFRSVGARGTCADAIAAIRAGRPDPRGST